MTVSLFRALPPSLRSTRKVALRNTITPVKTMATVKDHIPHMQRTANDPRQTGLFDARISRVDQINSQIRLLRLGLPIDAVGLPTFIELAPRLKHLSSHDSDICQASIWMYISPISPRQAALRSLPLHLQLLFFPPLLPKGRLSPPKPPTHTSSSQFKGRIIILPPHISGNQ